MPFLFNPCQPCCTIPKCTICANLALPRSWTVTFPSAGTDNSYVDTIDNRQDPCPSIFSPIVASFSPKYDEPCLWKGYNSKVLNTCTFGSNCNSNNCICDCATCFDILINPIRRTGAGCYDIAFGGGWFQAQISQWAPNQVQCMWDIGSSGSLFYGSMQLKKGLPITITLTMSDVPGNIWTALYTCPNNTCEDSLNFMLTSQVDAIGQAVNSWPATITAQKTVCNSAIPRCLCPGCQTDWGFDFPAITLTSEFITKWNPKIYSATYKPVPVPDGRGGCSIVWTEGVYPARTTAWDGGQIQLRGPLLDNSGNDTCIWQWGNNYWFYSGSVIYYGNEVQIGPGMIAYAFLYPTIGQAGGYSATVYKRGVIVVLQTFHQFGPFDSGNLATVKLYIQDISTATSNCNDFDGVTLNLVADADVTYRGDPNSGPPGRYTACGIYSNPPYSNYGMGGPSYALHDWDNTGLQQASGWPSSIVFKKIAKAQQPCSPLLVSCPNPYSFIATQVDITTPVNTPTSSQYTDDVVTSIEIATANNNLVATITAIYTNRCNNQSNPVILRDVKHYSISLSNFSCLGQNVLNLTDSPTGNICNNWPASITLSP